MRKVFKLLAESLEAHSVNQLFGLIGDGNLFMVDAWVREGSGHYTACAHEASAVLAALGYAQVANRTGVATITHGPGLTNAISALVEGVKGSIPIVLLCGDTCPHNRHHLQKLDQRELVKATGAGFVEMRSPDTASIDLARAFRRAALEIRPIVFNMRADLQWEETAAVPIVLPVPAVRNCVVEGEDLDNALGMIASAKRPFILAGRGAIAPEVRKAILKLARRIEAPVATTLKASGLFYGEKFNVGVLGTLSRPVAFDAIAKSDCIIVFGASLTSLTLGSYAAFGSATYFDDSLSDDSLLNGKRVVQILGNTREDERRSIDPDVLLVADPGLMAEKIIEVLNMAEIPPSQNADRNMADALRQETETYTQSLPFKDTKPGTIDYIPALRRINQVLPDDRMLVNDEGRFVMGSWRSFTVIDPHHFVMASNIAAIGLGVGEAIGAARAAPDKLTVLVTGDGGFTMGGLTELATIVNENLNMAIILCNDGGYGAEYIQFADKNMSPSLSLTNPPDFVSISESAGFKACRVTNPAELEMALKLLAEETGPRLIELRLDPDCIGL